MALDKWLGAMQMSSKDYVVLAQVPTRVRDGDAIRMKSW